MLGTGILVVVVAFAAIGIVFLVAVVVLVSSGGRIGGGSRVMSNKG